MHASELPLGIAYILVGIIILTSGRKLFWLFVGCIGFAVGFHYAPYLWNVQSGLFLIVIGIFLGIIGAILAVFFQKVAVGLAGFAAGGYIAVDLLSLVGIKIGQMIWLPYLAGGILGALLLFLIFDWALIIVSCLAGASMIVQPININPTAKLGLYFALIVIGLIIQTALFKKPPVERE